jgi:hypothetical protein
MMRWNDFGRSLVFGAVAAAAFVPFAVVATPVHGWSSGVAAYALLCSATYLAGLGATRRQGLTAAGVALLVGGTVAWIAPTPRDAIFAAALGLGLCRSGLLYRARFARSLLLEGFLLCAGLAAAAEMFGGSTFSAVLAVWIFFVIQSVFFLIGGVNARREGAEETDAFEAARARALELLEREGFPGVE